MNIFDVNFVRRMKDQIKSMNSYIRTLQNQYNQRLNLRERLLNKRLEAFVKSTAGLKQSSNLYKRRKIEYDNAVLNINRQTAPLLDAYNQQIIFYQNRTIQLENRINNIPADSQPVPVSGYVDTLALTIQTNSAFNTLITYLQNIIGIPPGGGVNPLNFIIPYIPTNYNLTLTRSEYNLGFEDYKVCKVDHLGFDNFGFVNSIEMRGYFVANIGSTRMLMTPGIRPENILTSGTYIAKELTIQPGSMDEQPIVINLDYDPNNFSEQTIIDAVASIGYSLDTTGCSIIYRVINSLTDWARDTAFLVPHFCMNHWKTQLGNPIRIPTTSNTGFVECETSFNPVCDPLLNLTYSNSCVAKRAGVSKPVGGSCNVLVDSTSRGNLSVEQLPLRPWDVSGNSLAFAPDVSNPLQAEYFSRLYAFMRKNINSTYSIWSLGSWASSYLTNYPTNSIPYFY